ncbi:hypothetical protein GUITHDRAFT_144404 [Guillardia theta CCMP2712]|uniref:Uncharacterized protein n=1 Tax=Guillardia theta (strain CCMP2712) TaxID=905079 RepID=L1IPY1_GUITC|nr:hypothetical protein GUITHDRAFT_144404 [Guillardia theta CCMP2712]EKX38298.1 hypothetical protein GUITHDRAFT_144404 [Guillardia theta CCMP2712]|eukprot:XP_005825278.1 hypothetical protein GUITHDRAFT_144404 [Guillardia theta CCMP2712]
MWRGRTVCLQRTCLGPREEQHCRLVDIFSGEVIWSTMGPTQKGWMDNAEDRDECGFRVLPWEAALASRKDAGDAELKQGDGGKKKKKKKVKGIGEKIDSRHRKDKIELLAVRLSPPQRKRTKILDLDRTAAASAQAVSLMLHDCI